MDALCPMLYTNDVRVFREYVKEAVAIAKGRCLVYAGIACISSHNKNTPGGVVAEMTSAREEHADGVVFSGYSLDKAFLDAIRR